MKHQSHPLTSASRITLVIALFLAVHFAALFSPSLLDDADATHANAARHMAQTGDWVTLKVNGIRYLEKPPLPYWLVSIDYRIFGYNVFATHLPMELCVLLCAFLAWRWSIRAYGERAGVYSAIAYLTTVGVFLFTRVYIPEAILTFLIAGALYTFLTALEDRKPNRFFFTYATLAFAMLTKGLIAPVFFLAAAFPYLLLTGEWRRWREFRLLSGTLLFLAITAPWHILAGLRNQGFFWFYFINEHVLRFLGRRIPKDYSKLPFALYWSLHLVWLFPWSLFFPLALVAAWRRWRGHASKSFLVQSLTALRTLTFTGKTTLLLAFYGAFILLFFSVSTNQEYYTFPAYFPTIILTCAALAHFEQLQDRPASRVSRRLVLAAHACFSVIGITAATALTYGLWSSRHLAVPPDIGVALARQSDYTLSMAHFFDLTGESFAALRLPSIVAAIALLIGPLIAWALRAKTKHFAATLSIALTSALFLVAAHIALVRFEPLLSSRQIADSFNGDASPTDTLIVYGDQSASSSVIFYTGRQAMLVNGKSSSMLWGSHYPDVPHIFLDDKDLTALWGKDERKFLVVPEENEAHVTALLGNRSWVVDSLSTHQLLTDRPLEMLSGTFAQPLNR